MREIKTDPTLYDLAIIGAGFCGIMVLANVIRKSHIPLKIAIIEKNPIPAKGVAYSTHDSSHLLNVRAARMGAFEEDPEHFYQWLKEHEVDWRKLDPSFKNLHIDPQGYIPRKIYGAYLENIWYYSLEVARHKNITVSIFQQEAENLEVLHDGNLLIHFADRTQIQSKTGVLATGVFPNKEFLDSALPAENYISNIWNAKAATALKFVPHTSLHKTIAVIGSGLTMLDAVTTLVNRGYEGNVVAISREAKLPETHSSKLDSHHVFIDMQNPPATALDLLKCIRKEVSRVMHHGGDWRSVIDALRPVTITLWMHLPLSEKIKIKRSLISLWNRHRHRVPPEYLHKIDRMRNRGKFTFIKGTVQSVRLADDHDLNVIYNDKSKNFKTLEANYVINCAGPNFKVDKNSSLLFRNLLSNNIIQSHPLGWGIAASPCYEVAGKAFGRLFAAGQILIGERFESIAVPELRTQCSELADRLLDML